MIELLIVVIKVLAVTLIGMKLFSDIETAREPDTVELLNKHILLLQVALVLFLIADILERIFI